jgi:penicillin-binding protein 2
MRASSPNRRFRTARYPVFASVVVMGFSMVSIGLLRLQVTHHEQYRDLAKENHVRLEVIRAPRGSIYDRNGVLLADSAPRFSIVFRPFPAESAAMTRVTQTSEWIRNVSTLVHLDTAEVQAAVSRANRSGQTEVLVRTAPFDVRAAVEEMRMELPGVEVQIEPLRRYPYETAASHLLGYAGQINERELEVRQGQGYRPGDLIGRTGVERSYEELLRGRDGAEFVVVNAMGRRVSTLSEGPPRLPVPGHDLVLTLDMKVQLALEEALSGVTRGAAVAIDPRDGGVLGLVSRPAFDPNEFSLGISSERWRLLNRDDNPLLNRAIQGVYPPGSTFKIVSMLASLRAGVAGPATRLAPCNGGYQFGSRWFGCWKREGHGSLNFVGALEHSCDVYFYQVGQKLGLERLDEAARSFGMGAVTGIDLPQEKQGLVPNQEWYQKSWGKRSHQAVMLNLAIGQGELLATPLQMAIVAATAGTQGRSVRPHIVHEVRGVPDFIKPRTGRPRITANADDWAAVRLGLEHVVTSGTGRGAQVPGLHVAGKTGTSQNPHGEDHALFICYAPAEDPTIAIAIVVENAGHGGSVAAPMAGRALGRVFLSDSMYTAYYLRPRPAVRRDTTVNVVGSGDYIGD